MPYSKKRSTSGKKKRFVKKKYVKKKSYKSHAFKRKRSTTKKSFKPRKKARPLRSKMAASAAKIGIACPSSLQEIAAADVPDAVRAAMMAKFNQSGQYSLTCRNPRAPIPDRFFCKFRWGQSNQSIQNAPALNAILGNGMFGLPLGANPANRPGYFSSFGAFYLNYQVMASRLSVRFQLTSQDDPRNVIIAAIIVNPASLTNQYIPNDPDGIRAWNVPHKVGQCASLQSAYPLGKVSMFAKTKDLYSVTSMDPGFAGTFANSNMTSPPILATNPSYMWWWIITQMSSTGNTSTDVLNAVDDVEYWTECFNPITQQDFTVHDKGTMDMSDPAVAPFDEEEFDRLSMEEAPPPPVYKPTPTLKRAGAMIVPKAR